MVSVSNSLAGKEDAFRQFLDRVPEFRPAYYASNKKSDEEMLEYIAENIDPHLDLLHIGIQGKGSSTTIWYKIARNRPIHSQFFLKRYATEYAMHPITSLVIKYKTRILFQSMKNCPCDLGMEDGDTLEVYLKSHYPNQENSSPEQLYLGEGNSGNNQVKLKQPKANGNRKKSSLSIPPQNEEQLLKSKHYSALCIVLSEAGERFKGIRRHLDKMNLQRMPPKDKSREPMISQDVTQASHLPINNAFRRAGKSMFMIRVGDTDHLYKTYKKTALCICNAELDLHGFTKKEALAQLNKSLTEWMDMAMVESSFVIQVKIVCGRGDQILSQAVEQWISQTKNVANAPKSLTN